MWRRLLHRTYSRWDGLRFRWRRRYTSAGRFAVLLFALGFMTSLDTNLTTGYQAFALVIAVLALSFLWATITALWRRRRTKPTFAARRELPRFGTAGQPCAYRLVVRNLTARRQSNVVALEDLDDPRPSQAEFVALPRPATPDWGARLDRLFGFSEWWDLRNQRATAAIAAQPLPDILPRDEAAVRVEFVPARRGRLRFAGLTIGQPDVFGLVRALTPLPAEQTLLILPKRYSLPPLELPGTPQYQPGGVQQALAVGASEDFVALRDYRPGDAPRKIHWPSVAKTDQLIVREYEDEFFARHALVLDTFAGPGDAAAFEEAVSVAASFVCHIHAADSLLDLLLVGNAAYCFTAGRGLGHVDQLLEVLACVAATPTGSFTALESLITAHAPLVSGCVCVFVGWDEPRRRLVDRIRALRVPVTVCVVTAAADAAWQAPGGTPFHVLPVGRIQEALARL